MPFNRLQNLKRSSMIHEMHYDADAQILRTKFVNGDIGEHLGVPASVIQQLTSAPSLGKAFHALIRNGGYDYRPVGVA